MNKKRKFYVVWKGRNTGIFLSWNDCKDQIHNFTGAKYKSFENKNEAKLAYVNGYYEYKHEKNKQKNIYKRESNFIKPIKESISVDAACSGNPGIMEYRGVLTKNKKEIFKMGPFRNGTNNIGEFLALVHGVSLLKMEKKNKFPIYTDSITAISWMKKKKCNTKFIFTSDNDKLFQLIKRAEKWLNENSYDNPILKWKTKQWGEIPADFGRK